MSSPGSVTSFAQLELSAPLQKALVDVGYETPSPIQARIIPHMLEGVDVLGQAQTGTGKTAAFALPILARLKLKQKLPQVLVLAPTRELAIQVAEAFQKYAAHIPGFHVLPIYGGSDYRGQFRQLQRGVHVVVGTPGRVMEISAALEERGAPTDPAVVQLSVVTASLAGLRLLDALGVEAEVAVGHSLGELTALHWAGAYDADALQRIATVRGRAIGQERNPHQHGGARPAETEKCGGGRSGRTRVRLC